MNESKWAFLKTLNLPTDQYLIIGSGPLGIRNLREMDDLDLLVTRGLWDELIQKYPVIESGQEKKIVFPGGFIEAFLEGSVEFKLGRISEREMIDGLPFDPLKNVIAFKKNRANPKDIQDLLRVQTFLKKDCFGKKLFADFLPTPLGPMLAIGDENVLYLLEFLEKKNLPQEWERLEKKTGSTILLNSSQPILSIDLELEKYFAGALQQFKTPFLPSGSPFQLQVWEELQKIPFGKTRSYKEIARAIGRETACRAVARANSTNCLAIIIPCHRVIETSGALGGYAGGVDRKKKLLEVEQKKS